MSGREWDRWRRRQTNSQLERMTDELTDKQGERHINAQRKGRRGGGGGGGGRRIEGADSFYNQHDDDALPFPVVGGAPAPYMANAHHPLAWLLWNVPMVIRQTKAQDTLQQCTAHNKQTTLTR